MPRARLFDGPGDWKLARQGAVVHPPTKTAVIADVHLGYEFARAGSGDDVPEHSLDETWRKLDALFAEVPIERLVVAGDLLETRRPCKRARACLSLLLKRLAGRRIEAVALRGNHDPPDLFDASAPAHLEIDGWTIGHGHLPLSGSRTITGHEHPALRYRNVSFPCFLVGDRRMILPAFSNDAAGLPVDRAIVPEAWTAANLRCVVGVEDDWLDFGPIVELREKLRGAK